MIHVTLLLPNGERTDVPVNEMDPLKSLEHFYPEVQSAYLIHHNQIVCPSFSFQFLKIQDGDTITIIRGTKTHVKTLTKPKEQDTEIIKRFAKIQGINDKAPSHLILEGARLKDLYMLRNENLFMRAFQRKRE